MNETTSSYRLKILGAIVLLSFIALLIFAFWVSPTHNTQGNAVRLLYIHVPLAVGAYVCLIACAVASLVFLIKKKSWWDFVALSTAEIGTIFCGLTLVTGAIWGRPIWNTWWEWGDVRLISTLILFLLFLGYLALRSMPSANPSANSKRAAIVALIAVIDIPIINRSVEWWQNRTLHQRSTLANPDLIQGWTLFTLVVGFVAFGLLIIWLAVHRFRVAWLSAELQKSEIDMALQKRLEET